MRRLGHVHGCEIGHRYCTTGALCHVATKLLTAVAKSPLHAPSHCEAHINHALRTYKRKQGEAAPPRASKRECARTVGSRRAASRLEQWPRGAPCYSAHGHTHLHPHCLTQVHKTLVAWRQCRRPGLAEEPQHRAKARAVRARALHVRRYGKRHRPCKTPHTVQTATTVPTLGVMLACEYSSHATWKPRDGHVGCHRNTCAGRRGTKTS